MPRANPNSIEIDGLTFHYRVDGPEGAPWLVFSNSLMTDLSLWDDQAAAFGESFRILRYDQRGHGRTGIPAEDCTMERLAADLIGLMDALGIARAHLVGISMGAATCLGAALAQPRRVASLVMADGQAATPTVARRRGRSGSSSPAPKAWTGSRAPPSHAGSSPPASRRTERVSAAWRA